MKKEARILYLVNSFNSGGAERGILSLIDTGFFDNLYVDIVAIHKGTGPLLDELASKKFNGSIHCVTEDENISVGAMVKTFFYIIKQIRTKKVTHLMLSLVQSNIIGLCVAHFFPKVRVITFAHNSRFSKNVYAALLRLLSLRIHFCLFDDYSSEKAMRKLFLRRNRKWLYAPLHSINIEKMDRSYNIEKEAKILSVGRLNQQKNYPEALKAIQILKEKGLNVHFTINGTGEEEESLHALAKELNITPNITFNGFIQNWVKSTPQYDIFLLSSIYEGMSIVTVEAMGAAMPIVATNVGGVQEYGGHLSNMYVAQEPTAEHIAEALEALILNEDLRRNIGTQAAKDATFQFGHVHVKELIRKARSVIFRNML